MPRVLLATFAFAFVSTASAAEPLHAQIDRHIAAGHKDYANKAAPLASDEEFLRRVYLDLNGTIPPVDEVREFLAESSSDKREKLIDRLVDDPGYARRMAYHFDVMLMERRRDTKVPRADWEKYLRATFAANKPYDEFVSEMLSNDGSDKETRAAAKFFLDRDLEPNLVTRDLARVFLGRDLQCSQCHDHPRNPYYLQADYYGILAFINRSFLFPNDKAATAVIAEKAEGEVNFTSVFDKSKKQGETGPRLPGMKALLEPKLEKGKEYKVKPEKNVKPVPVYSRFSRLADSMTSPENPAFARTAVNRLWAMMMGRGLIDPVDQDHPDNPPSHPKLLDLLAEEFVAHDYDIKWLLREIALSETYQRSSVVPKGLEEVPPAAYLVANLKPLSPEQLAFAVCEATGMTGNERRALGKKMMVEAVDVRLGSTVAAFRKVFAGGPGEPEDGTTTLDQTLFLKNDDVVRKLIAPRSENLAARIAKMSNEAAAEELFLAVLTRPPTEDEKKDVIEVLKDAKDRPAICGELVWALVASGEFRFNH